MSAPAELLREAWPVLVAYVVGATPFGYLAGKLRGIDIRQHGSGNIGATNVHPRTRQTHWDHLFSCSIC
jgi:glycerol-3-phosphate acyltransferase PlsY